MIQFKKLWEVHAIRIFGEDGVNNEVDLVMIHFDSSQLVLPPHVGFLIVETKGQAVFLLEVERAML